MIKAEVDVNNGSIAISPHGHLADILTELVMLNVATVRIATNSIYEDEEKVLDLIVEALTDRREEIREMVFTNSSEHISI